MDTWIILLCQLIPLGLILYTYINRKYSHWSNLGVKGPKPSILSFGNVFQIVGEIPIKVEVENVRKYGKVYGNYVGFEPILTVADHELAKQILVKDFPQWTNRRKLKAYHELNNNNQFNAEGEKWKRLRTITGKTFTTGKLKGMNPMMDKCVDKLTSYMDTVATGNGILSTKSVVSGFTIDVIAATSFATETNSNDDRQTKNVFVENALKLLEINPMQILSYLAMPMWFNNLVGVHHSVNAQCWDFFANLAGTVIEQRKKASSGAGKRTDLVQLLIDSYALDAELKDDNYDKLTADMGDEVSTTQPELNGNHPTRGKTKLTDTEIKAQSLLFFLAGFETTATTISNIFFELSQAPQVQDKLCDEIHSALDGIPEHSQEYNDAVNNRVPYMDAVIKETLRKYPPVVRLERRLVVDEYKLNGIPLKKDQLVEIPTVAVHYNPEYYPEPEKFNPDRFMPENKDNLVPYTYMPFGIGPRNCVGMRFAYQEIKLCLAKIIPKFKLGNAPSTPETPQFDKFKALLFVKPFEIKVTRRN